jgi:D-3-phosphoglycerate dehydrogenase
MYKIRTYNKISNDGLDILKDKGFEVSDSCEHPDGIVLRSQKLHDMDFPETLKAIGRAGAGVNNIPVDKCTEHGVVVFNTPGANANAVKELVLAGLLLSARDIVGGINYSQSLQGKGSEVHTLVEKNKSNFKGFELKGKKIGVIGLGAIGVMVANAAVNLGMKVYGYDPFISVDRAWGLSSTIKQATNLNKLLSEVDFVTLHMPLTDGTRDFVNKDRISKMKKGAIVLNFSRPEIIEQEAVIASLEAGHLAKYVCDFPSEELLSNENVIAIPHLGASTSEAEDNCAVMIANQISDYLINGNIVNSVNFPTCHLEKTGDFRLAIINENKPNMVGQITAKLAEFNLNISEMINKGRGDIAYTLVDVSGSKVEGLEDAIKGIEGVLSFRVIG